jgi:anaerobic selenocysteine-containing dehydrogenase
MLTIQKADTAIVVGFSMSDFDAMAQMQFAEIARCRFRDKRPLRVIVVDPYASEEAEQRFRRVFGEVTFIKEHHESLEWAAIE